MKNLRFRIVSVVIVLIAISLSACSRSPLKSVNELLRGNLGKKEVNYGNNASVKNLEIPPDLTAPEYDKAFELPVVGSTVSLRSGGYISSNAISSSSSGSNITSRRTGNLSSVRSLGDGTVLQIHDTYQRALILTDIMLVRLGFSVLSRSSSGNVLKAQYNGNSVVLGEANTKGRIASLFDRTKRMIGISAKSNFALEKGKTYQISVLSEKGANLLKVNNGSGQSLSSAANNKIISLLNSEFNR